jgi:7-cyano-7-deazaguanine synthase
MRTCLVVLSGGQDSTTCLFWAKQNFDLVKAITFDYGQRHIVELNAATAVASMAKVDHEIVRVPNILKSRSPLTDPNTQLETYTDYKSMDQIIGDRVELTFVPMRNAFFLTLAANRALYHDIYDLVTGVCQMDDANYPDTREGFIRSQEETISKALGDEKKLPFVIHTPLIYKTKAETVKLAKELSGCWEALAYSHTCYAGRTPPCIMTEREACHACTLRQHGFEEAGELDPLIERYKKELVQK